MLEFAGEGNVEQFNGREGETAALLSRRPLNLNLCGGGFAPRHLSRSVSSLLLGDKTFDERYD